MVHSPSKPATRLGARDVERDKKPGIPILRTCGAPAEKVDKLVISLLKIYCTVYTGPRVSNRPVIAPLALLDKQLAVTSNS